MYPTHQPYYGTQAPHPGSMMIDGSGAPAHVQASWGTPNIGTAAQALLQTPQHYGIGPGNAMTPAVREEAKMAPLFALGLRDWFYVAIGVGLTLAFGWLRRRMVIFGR